MRIVVCRQCEQNFETEAPRVHFCSLECRFWSGVQKRGEDECWPWLLSRPKGTYGQLSQYDASTRKRFNEKSHRVCYRLKVGPLQQSDHVLHRCDNPPCCNPRHLFIGEHAANMDDKAQKLRAGKKIDAETARSIKNAEGSSRTIAAAFDVSPSLVKQIRAGTVWRYA